MRETYKGHHLCSKLCMTWGGNRMVSTKLQPLWEGQHVQDPKLTVEDALLLTTILAQYPHGSRVRYAGFYESWGVFITSSTLQNADTDERPMRSPNSQRLRLADGNFNDRSRPGRLW